MVDPETGYDDTVDKCPRCCMCGIRITDEAYGLGDLDDPESEWYCEDCMQEKKVLVPDWLEKMEEAEFDRKIRNAW